MKISLTNNMDVCPESMDAADVSTRKLNHPVFEHLINLKISLGSAKSTLDLYNLPGDKKSKILSNFNPFKYEKYNLAKTINANNVTNAWLKCYEIISEFNLINSNSGDITHFDNASLPGSFILSTHHYVKTLYPDMNYRWLASSMINDTVDTVDTVDTADTADSTLLSDDYHLYRNYPDNWMMDSNNNGDITNVDNIDDIVKKNNKSGINFFTSDLGFDVSKNFNQQEILHFGANIGQVLLCINLLEIGGNCVIKHYSIFELFSLSYLFLFSKLFEKCWIYKPVTSKRANSEIYIVGINFLNNCKDVHSEQRSEQMLYLLKLNSLLRKSLIKKQYVPIIDVGTLINFTSYILPLLINLTNHQIKSLLHMDEVLSNLYPKYCDDLYFCKKYIYNSINRGGIREYYEKCIFFKIKNSDKLKVNIVYN